MRTALPRPTGRQPRSRGFSLVELLVGIVVAMAAVVVVMQVFKVSEGQRRSTTGADDAQNAGAIALTLLQRDLRQAGQGIANLKLMGCTLTVGGKVVDPLAPFAINPDSIPDGDAGTDVIMLAYGTGLGAPEGDRITLQPSASSYRISAAQAFKIGDQVIAAPEVRVDPCALTLTPITAGPPGAVVTVGTGVAGVSNGALFDLGAEVRLMVYAVRNGRLTACNFSTQDCTSVAEANWSEVADGIVSMRAQYGRDTAAVGARDAAVDVFDQTTPTTVCGWSRVMGARVVLVARSGQYNADVVTTAQPGWAGSADAPVGLSGDDWQHYRYKTFETTVPLRNVPDANNPDFASC